MVPGISFFRTNLATEKCVATMPHHQQHLSSERVLDAGSETSGFGRFDIRLLPCPGSAFFTYGGSLTQDSTSSGDVNTVKQASRSAANPSLLRQQNDDDGRDLSCNHRCTPELPEQLMPVAFLKSPFNSGYLNNRRLCEGKKRSRCVLNLNMLLTSDIWGDTSGSPLTSLPPTVGLLPQETKLY